MSRKKPEQMEVSPQSGRTWQTRLCNTSEIHQGKSDARPLRTLAVPLAGAPPGGHASAGVRRPFAGPVPDARPELHEALNRGLKPLGLLPNIAYRDRDTIIFKPMLWATAPLRRASNGLAFSLMRAGRRSSPITISLLASPCPCLTRYQLRDDSDAAGHRGDHLVMARTVASSKSFVQIMPARCHRA